MNDELYRPLYSLDDIVTSPDDPRLGRTRQAQEFLEIAYMLARFAELGAPVTPPILGWARSMLWRNGET